jgi:hypothetical protein
MTLVYVAADATAGIEAGGVALLVAVAAVAVAVGAAVTRRFVPVIIAGLLATAAPAATSLAIVFAACAAVALSLSVAAAIGALSTWLVVAVGETMATRTWSLSRSAPSAVRSSRH